MRIALVQVASPEEEPIEERRQRVADVVRSARGADLVVLPELWASGYFAFDSYATKAEAMDGPTVATMAEVARELECLVHVGSFVEKIPGGGIRNTAALLGSDGQVLHSYSKIHVFGYQSREAELLQPGDALGSSPTPFGQLASTTCYDLRFPELWRRLVDVGAEMVVVPAAWPAARVDHWRLFTSVRAVEEQVHIVACNAVGEQAGKPLGGTSRIIDPWGAVLVEAGSQEGITWCDVSPERVHEVRKQFPVLTDRLQDYTALTVREAQG